MGEMPMPEGCNFETMMVMYKVVKNMEDKEYAAEQIKFYEELWRKWKPKYDEDKDNLNLCAIMKYIKEGILLYREWLNEG